MDWIQLVQDLSKDDKLAAVIHGGEFLDKLTFIFLRQIICRCISYKPPLLESIVNGLSTLWSLTSCIWQLNILVIISVYSNNHTTPCSRVLLEKLIILQQLDSFSQIYRPWMFITVFTRAHLILIFWTQFIPCSSIIFLEDPF